MARHYWKNLHTWLLPCFLTATLLAKDLLNLKQEIADLMSTMPSPESVNPRPSPVPSANPTRSGDEARVPTGDNLLEMWTKQNDESLREAEIRLDRAKRQPSGFLGIRTSV